MRLNFCTLFDSNFLIRGIALYESLIRACPNAYLYILTLDTAAYDLLNFLNLERATIVSLDSFENEALLKVKASRSFAEYCWTCTPSAISFFIKHFQLDSCIYLDADLYFIEDPCLLLQEMPQEKSVLITAHNYAPRYDQSEKCGKYCVQFLLFKNNEASLRILETWQNQCLEWCYARCEDGKFGDQKYLDEWPVKYPNDVHILEHKGGGIAPWNISLYTFNQYPSHIIARNLATHFNLIFYHFHDIKNFENQICIAHSYEISPKAYQIIYYPYIVHLEKIRILLHFHFPHLPIFKIPYNCSTNILDLKKKKNRLKKIGRYFRSIFKK